MSSTPLTNSLEIVPSSPITIGIAVTFIFYGFFFRILLCGLTGRQSPLFGRFFFFFLLLLIITWSGRLAETFGDPFDLKKNPVKFVCLILLDRFRIVHIPFVFMVKFKFLAQFPVDHLPHPVVPSIILSLR